MLEIWGLGNGCYGSGEASFEILYHVISQRGGGGVTARSHKCFYWMPCNKGYNLCIERFFLRPILSY